MDDTSADRVGGRPVNRHCRLPRKPLSEIPPPHTASRAGTVYCPSAPHSLRHKRRRTMLKGSYTLSVCALALLIAACSENAPTANTQNAPQNNFADAKAGPDGWAGTIRGTVSNVGGDPTAGAFVKLRNEDRHLTVMVVSQEDGGYVAAKLPPGNWTVQGVGGDVESKWSQPVLLPTTGS